jgi:glycosyltransferase involved in cell wall biosynthesis
MTSPPPVSVVVPAYNSEAYIEECLRSLFAQTLEPLEIVVVDDGSTDRTAEIVRSLAVPPGKRLRLLHKANGGLSSARNFGIAAAAGRWIGLVDSDDWARPEMYARLLDGAERHAADLAICSGCTIDHATGTAAPFRDQPLWRQIMRAPEQLFDPAKTHEIFVLDTQAGRRLYRRSFLDSARFRFAEGFLFEDVLASYQLLFRTHRVVLVEGPYYCYREGHPGRITARKDAKILQIVEIMEGAAAELAAHGASADLWAGFIRYQNWSLLWLCNQVEIGHRREFAARACRLARQFPRDGIRAFRRKFADEARSQEGVFLQLLGWPEAYRAYADYEGMKRFARYLYAREWPRRLLSARAPRVSKARMPEALKRAFAG